MAEKDKKPNPIRWNDIPPLSAPEGAQSIYGRGSASQQPPAAPEVAVPTAASTLAQMPQQQAGQSGLNANWWSPAYARAASMSEKTGLELERDRAASAPAGMVANDPVRSILTTGAVSAGQAPTPAAQSPQTPSQTPTRSNYSNEGKNYPAGSTAQSPAQTTAPATPEGSPKRNAAGALTSLGAGVDQGNGVTRIDVPGQSPLFTDRPGAADNLALMNRRAISPQNAAAMDALAGRYAADTAQAVQRMQYQDQVAQAQAINARPNPTQPLADKLSDLTSPESKFVRNQSVDANNPAFRAEAERRATAVLQGGIDAQNTQAATQAANNFKQQEIDMRGREVAQRGTEFQSGAEKRGLEADVARMTIAEKKQLQAATNDYLQADTPAKEKAAVKKLAALNGKFGSDKPQMHVVSNPSTESSTGAQIGGGQSLVVFQDGVAQVVPIGPKAGVAKTAPASAVAYLEKNPGSAKAFKDKYGYLPEGFKQ